MDTLFEYIDTFPTLPENIENEVFRSIEVNESVWYNKLYPKNYQLYNVLDDLELFVKKFLTNHLIQIHVIENKLIIHKDRNRPVAYNYILSCGGPNVTTCFYDDSFSLIYSVNILPKRWHKISTKTYHNVINLETPRIAITVSPMPK